MSATLNGWLMGHLRAAGYATQAAVDAALAALPDLDDETHGSLDREGISALMAQAVKETKLVVRQQADDEAAGQMTLSLPLMVAIRDEDTGTWLRQEYLELTRKRHAALLRADEAQLVTLTARVALERNDAALWEQHPTAGTIRDLYAAAGIDFEIVTGTDG